MSIQYFHLVDNESFSNRKFIVDAILQAEYEGENSAWCVMYNGKPVIKSHNFDRIKRELDYIWDRK
jgi:hypothetical protein